MVLEQLSLSEHEQNQRADRGLQEETAAALHPSYDQRVSLLIIPCIIYYVTNKETLNLEP